MKDKIKKVIPVAGLIILFVIFSLTTQGRFLTVNNLKNIVMQGAITLVAAVGTTFVMAHNNLDFSLGGACALGSVLAYLISGGNLYAFFLLAIVFGIGCGLISSVIHICGRVPAFMAGLCIMFAGRGLAQTVAAKKMMLMAQAAQFNNIVFFMIVLVVVYAVGYFLFNFTKLGKYQKLIGTNPKAAELSGINVNQYKMLAFLVSGVTIGIASCMTVIRNAAINGNTGLNLETDVLLALCLGGLPMTGGSTSKMNSVLIGVAIYYILNNGLLLWGLNADYVDIVKAIFFLGTVAISLDRSQYEYIA